MVRLYTPKDLKEINEWYYKRGHTPVDETFLPKIGYIYEGVAVGFLYQTDANVAILESYVTNPSVEKITRYHAIKCITDALMETATNLRFKKIMAITRSESIIEHCKEYQMTPVGSFEVYSKEL